MTDGGASALHIPCTQCGGPLPVTDDVPFVRCTHCRATLFLDLGRYVHHGAVRARLGRADVESAVLRHLEAVEAERPSHLDSVRREHRPWYVVPAPSGSVAVAAFADDDGIDASPAGRAAVSGEVVPFDSLDAREDGGDVVPPSLLADAAVARVEGGRAEGVRLVHVPVDVVRWRHRGESYRAVVDAVLGSVAAPRLPPRSATKLDAQAITVMTLATAACAAEAALLPGWLLPLAANAATAAVVTFFGRRGEGTS